MLITFVALLPSCIRQDSERNIIVNISGSELPIEELSVADIVYADDSLVVATSYASTHRFEVHKVASKEKPIEFLKTGRGPLDVQYAHIKHYKGELHILSYKPYGELSRSMIVPLKKISDMGSWKISNHPARTPMLIGTSFDIINDSTYVILGGPYGEENIISFIESDKKSVSPLGFWPDDEYVGTNIIPKQLMYAASSYIFSNGNKLLYVCSDGKYATILDYSQQPPLENKIYDEYPLYKESTDGLNPKRDSKSKLGMKVYANDSSIYLMSLDCMLKNGCYIPDDFKGYPPYYNDRIEVYNWDGEYICTYLLDIPCGTFYISDDNKSLYALSCSPHTAYNHIYKYELTH